MCREAGARVARNVRLADMNLDLPVLGAWRIGVVCNGPSRRHGEQFAVDAMLVSPFGRDGLPRADSHVHLGVILSQAPRAGHSTPLLGGFRD